MFDLDSWSEIFSTIKKNKLRTFLTGFAISWGIFMFVILLSAGNGFQNGVMSSFGSRATNSIQFWGRWTSVPYEGLPDNRRIVIDDKDMNLVRTQVPEADNISGIINTTVAASFETNSSSLSFVGVNPEYRHVNGIRIKDGQGRFINTMDMQENRKVAVVNQRVKEVLFKDEDPVGKQFVAGGLGYTVIGVFEEDSWGNEEKAYVPFSTAQLLYNRGWGISDISFTVNGLQTLEANEAFETELRNKLSRLHTFDPDDRRAIGVRNTLHNYLQTLGIFNGISAFIWVMGIGTLIAGIIGVSNIMLITVRERTREFGIRKALGAKPSSILQSIIMESVLITSIFGYLGLFLGISLSELVNTFLQYTDNEMLGYIFRDPTVDVGVAVGAMLVLIVSGVLAGYFPALKAVKVSPVEAMRAE